MNSTQILMHNCAIYPAQTAKENDSKTPALVRIASWEFKQGETWLVSGPNGGGKSAFASALSGTCTIVPLFTTNATEGDSSGRYFNRFEGSIFTASFEAAAALIAQERRLDDSEYIEGGVDEGRTPRKYLFSLLPPAEKDRYPLGEGLEHNAFVELCGIGHILDRGLKYLSTGEIRRTLLAAGLASQPALLILDEPFEGLDTQTRTKLGELLKMLMNAARAQTGNTQILLLSDRFESIPQEITHVLELGAREVSFCGTRAAYETLYNLRAVQSQKNRETRRKNLKSALERAAAEGLLQLPETIRCQCPELISMKDVRVVWSDKTVLDGLTWRVCPGEHWLIRGPNGSGKTTLLELVTGDNPQVFANDVRLFGKKRGSGETIWELKEKMGIVSYRLHTDYRNFGDLTLAEVVLSGLHDSIGLYRRCGEVEMGLARSWLDLCGFENRYDEHFGNLSYGEQRAVLITRAAVKCPPLLILDEPCHGLDSENRERILLLLQSIAESGTSTLLHVTHDPDEVLPCETRILELCPQETPMYRIIENTYDTRQPANNTAKTQK